MGYQSHDDENELYDLSGLDCPRCGCNDVVIVKRPMPGKWFGCGKAQCRYCGRVFSVRVEGDLE